MSETKIRAALFDMDGTILDSSVIWNTIARDTLLALNYVPRTDIARETYDLDACDVASYMIETYHMKESFSCVNDMLFSGLLEFYRFHAGLKPGAKAFLEELKQNSVFIALISASPYEFIYPSLKRNGERSRHPYLRRRRLRGNLPQGYRPKRNGGLPRKLERNRKAPVHAVHPPLKR